LTWSEWAPFLAQGGVTSILLLIGYRLHKDAVDAERRRADDARDRALKAEQLAEVLQQQRDTLLGRRGNGGGRPSR
jgi:hypothetical protein